MLHGQAVGLRPVTAPVFPRLPLLPNPATLPCVLGESVVLATPCEFRPLPESCKWAQCQSWGRVYVTLCTDRIVCQTASASTNLVREPQDVASAYHPVWLLGLLDLE